MRWLVVAALVVGCGKSEDATGSAAASAKEAEDSGPRADLIDAWKKAGLNPSGFAPAKAQAGKDCRTGTVNNVEVLVCVFASPTEAKAAEDAGLAWVGETTGAAQAHGSLLIAVADRKKTDPNGKMINQMMKLAPK